MTQKEQTDGPGGTRFSASENNNDMKLLINFLLLVPKVKRVSSAPEFLQKGSHFPSECLGRRYDFIEFKFICY